MCTYSPCTCTSRIACGTANTWSILLTSKYWEADLSADCPRCSTHAPLSRVGAAFPHHVTCSSHTEDTCTTFYQCCHPSVHTVHSPALVADYADDRTRFVTYRVTAPPTMKLYVFLHGCYVCYRTAIGTTITHIGRLYTHSYLPAEKREIYRPILADVSTCTRTI